MESAQGQWVSFVDQTSTRLSASNAVGLTNPDEKDYAWADVDQDGDIDLVAVYKEPFTTTGRRRNVLFMNEGVAQGHAQNGILVDRTNEFIPSFLDLTNDRDVILADVNGDGWLDIITATTLSGSQPKSISHPRIYINRGVDGLGQWLGFIFDDVNRVPTMPQEPRFCGVAAGDIDGDNDLDLYFSDYDQGPYSRPQDLNDRLWINNGLGYFTDQTSTRLTQEMVLSAFGMATAIADMNGDGALDIVKDTALAFPQRVSITYNDPGNLGFFNVFDVVYDNAPYHVSVGDLNNDNMLDLVVTDDGSDRYLLNQGNTGGIATFVERTFVGTNPGDFGGEQIIADLNNDGFEDVFITDVDVDIPGCGRVSKLYRNLGNTPSVTLQDQGNGGITTGDMTGLHDAAIFDINGDGWKDVVLGKCTGTKIYMNQPPVGLLFSYPSGIPFFVRPDIGASFLVQVSGQPGATPQGGTGTLFVSVNNGPFTSSTMTHLGNNLYQGILPAGGCTDRLKFYVRAQSTAGGTFFDPPTAPATTYNAVLAVNSVIVLRDEIEGNTSNWTIVNDASLTGGGWVQVDPNGTVFGSNQAAPEDDATQAANKVMAFVTGNGLPGAPAADSDVDGGPTRLISPVIDLAGSDATISYSKWFFSGGSATPDTLRVEISNNGGGSWVLVENAGSTNSAWATGSFLVGDFVTPTANVQVRFSVTDSPNDSVTEAGIDNFQVEALSCAFCAEDKECNDNNPCTSEFCNHGVCEYSGNNLPCNDNDLCTINDVCSVGNCIGTHIPGCIPCSVPGDCLDGNPCTDDSCTGGVCVFSPNSLPCNDGNNCTVNDICAQAVCGGDVIPNCQACVTNVDCDDGRFCNGPETCVSQLCQPGVRPCKVGQPCDELADVCELYLQARMGDPVLGLTAAELERFEAGQAQFDRDFSIAEGIGPIMNQTSCGQCHNASGAGGAGSTVVTRFGRQDKFGFDPLADLGGSLLQAQAISDTCRELIPEEANVTALRVTPPIFGAGLVESIADADIVANATNPPPGVGGIVHMVSSFEDPPGSQLRVGRFGWKAQVATLLTFSADALLNEMGITNRFIPLENAPNGNQTLLASCDTVPDPEDGPDGSGFHFIDRVTDFQRFLAQPPQTPKSGMSGEALFNQVGCNACHKAQFVTRNVVEGALSNRTIQPYSDFLLHNMGILGDGIVQGDAPSNRMRTAPLWGLRVRDPLLHDASVGGGTFADRIRTVVTRHGMSGSEAVASSAAFAALFPEEQDAIIAFLDSLGRAEFDHDGDGGVDIADFVAFKACYLDPGQNYSPDDPCAVSDIEQDGDVDGEDYALFLTAYDGVLPDCNSNSVVDFTEILNGTGNDCNKNAVLDACDGYLCNDGNACTDDSCNATVCMFVENSAACDDADACSTADVCAAGVCAGTPTVSLYGDISPSGGNGVIDVDDVLCMLDAFADLGACPDADLMPCGGNGLIDVDDVLAELDAFAGIFACPHPCPPPD